MDIFIYEIAGYISIPFSLVAFAVKNTSLMKIYGAISASLFAFSIYGYGGVNGAFVSIFSVFVKTTSFFVSNTTERIIKILAIPTSVTFYFFINEDGVTGLLPAIALVFIVFADFQKNIIKMKMIYLFSASLWLIYALAINSLPAILYDVFGILILLSTIFTSRKTTS